jgi:hypothetical protein
VTKCHVLEADGHHDENKVDSRRFRPAGERTALQGQMQGQKWGGRGHDANAAATVQVNSTLMQGSLRLLAMTKTLQKP